MSKKCARAFVCFVLFFFYLHSPSFWDGKNCVLMNLWFSGVVPKLTWGGVSIFWKRGIALIYFSDFIYLLLETGEGREEGKGRNINVWLPLTRPLQGTQTATQECALTEYLTDDLLVHRLALNPLSHTSQGRIVLILTTSGHNSDNWDQMSLATCWLKTHPSFRACGPLGRVQGLLCSPILWSHSAAPSPQNHAGDSVRP